MVAGPPTGVATVAVTTATKEPSDDYAKNEEDSEDKPVTFAAGATLDANLVAK